MGAQAGSGRKGQLPELLRTIPIRVMVREGQAADLQAVADTWGVALGTAGYAIIAERLSEWRGVTPDLGSVGLRRAAHAHALRAAGLE